MREIARGAENYKNKIARNQLCFVFQMRERMRSDNDNRSVLFAFVCVGVLLMLIECEKCVDV